jgi:hypothetical protein
MTKKAVLLIAEPDILQLANAGGYLLHKGYDYVYAWHATDHIAEDVSKVTVVGHGTRGGKAVGHGGGTEFDGKDIGDKIKNRHKKIANLAHVTLDLCFGALEYSAPDSILSEVKDKLGPVSAPGLKMTGAKGPTITCKTADTDKRIYVADDQANLQKIVAAQIDIEKTTKFGEKLADKPLAIWLWDENAQGATLEEIVKKANAHAKPTVTALRNKLYTLGLTGAVNQKMANKLSI